MRTTRAVKKLKVASKFINFELEKSYIYIYEAGILNSTGISTQTIRSHSNNI